MRLNVKQIALGLGLIGLAVIVTALASEYIGELTPCALCLQQRLPYYIGVPLALFAAWWAGHARQSARGLLAPLAFIFALSAGLGAYHAGVEYGWWLGPQSCGADIVISDDTADLLRRLETPQAARCEDASFTLFGISMAGYNFIASFGLTGLALFGLTSAHNGELV